MNLRAAPSRFVGLLPLCFRAGRAAPVAHSPRSFSPTQTLYTPRTGG
uniref:Uncharacterized protein n=1 Tax=Anguilla anguilla TaxID=7936 RepID=A0A0E9S9T6_ANGAN